jgi:hypothetical protein
MRIEVAELRQRAKLACEKTQMLRQVIVSSSKPRVPKADCLSPHPGSLPDPILT